MLIAKLESISLKDYETVSKLNIELNFVVNSNFKLGDTICNSRVVTKILRYLLKYLDQKLPLHSETKM